MKLLSKIIIIVFIAAHSIIAQVQHFDPVPVTKNVTKITEKIFPQYPTSYFDKYVYAYKDGRALKKETFVDGYIENAVEYTYFDSDYVSTHSEISTHGKLNKRILTYYNEFREIERVEIHTGLDKLSLTSKQDSFFYNSEGKMFGYTQHIYLVVHSDGRPPRDTVVINYYAEYDDQLRVNYVESVNKETNSLIIQNIYYNDKDKTVLMTTEGVALDPEKEVAENLLYVENHLYQLNDQGDWIKSYYINWKGKKELLAKRRIQYK
ncbi:MAG: hypothetical protein HKN09_12020 [Saprospiraceae bacterium]|nr:hypothetical protein [Saprospiraceae bacterium]